MTLDNIFKLITVLTTLGLGVLGAQVWLIGPNRRKANAEAQLAEATSAQTLSSVSVSLVEPLQKQLDSARIDLAVANRKITALTLYVDQQRNWEADVVRITRDAGGPVLPAPPKRPQFDATDDGNAPAP